MKIEEGKVVKLAIVNHLAGGQVWGTFEQEGLYPDDFSYRPLRESLLNLEINEAGSVGHKYLGEIKRSPELIFKLPVSNFKGAEPIREGMVFKTQFQMKQFNGLVTEVGKEFITLDCNHPYIGNSSLTTSFTVVDIREPSTAELKNGFKATLTAI